MTFRGRSWWSARTVAFVVFGATVGVGAWAVGPRLALAVLVGVGVTGVLLVLPWLRTTHIRLAADIRALEQRLTADRSAALAAITARLEESHRDGLIAADATLRAELRHLETRLRTAQEEELMALEQRLRISGSAELTAWTKRLRAGRSGE